MKHAAVWAAATFVATAAVICLPVRSARADGDSNRTSCIDAGHVKVGKSGRVYVWRPGGC